jgi:hypothetical protein
VALGVARLRLDANWIRSCHAAMPGLENRHRGLHPSRGAPCRIAIFGLWVAVFTFATSWSKSAAMPYVLGAVFVEVLGSGFGQCFWT